MVDPSVSVNYWNDWAKNMISEGERLSQIEYKISGTHAEAGKKAAVAVTKMREAALAEADSLFETMRAEQQGSFSLDFDTATAEWMSELSQAQAEAQVEIEEGLTEAQIAEMRRVARLEAAAEIEKFRREAQLQVQLIAQQASTESEYSRNITQAAETYRTKLSSKMSKAESSAYDGSKMWRTSHMFVLEKP